MGEAEFSSVGFLDARSHRRDVLGNVSVPQAQSGNLRLPRRESGFEFFDYVPARLPRIWACDSCCGGEAFHGACHRDWLTGVCSDLLHCGFCLDPKWKRIFTRAEKAAGSSWHHADHRHCVCDGPVWLQHAHPGAFGDSERFHHSAI